MSIQKPPTPLPNAFEELDRVQPPRGAVANTYPPEENGETGEFVPVDWLAASPNSSNSPNSSPGKAWRQVAVIPPDSILTLWRHYARKQVEGVDAYIVGSVLPVCAALLGRRVWFPWGDDRRHPNLFILLAGKPGDRKSSTIKLAAGLSRRLLPSSAFLPSSFSPEAMFDEYETRPDKLYVVDEANTVLTDWAKATNGERVASRFLELYDCKPMSESFRRNKSKEDLEAGGARAIEETSTSVLFGATFNVANFQGQAVRAGMARRFLYYCADGLGRTIIRPGKASGGGMEKLAESFRPLLEIRGEMDFTPETDAIWTNFQNDNRARIDRADVLREDVTCRLSSAPMQTLAVAMIFQISRWALEKKRPALMIEPETLTLAIEHVEECLKAAEFLDGLSGRARIAADAEVMLATIQHEFRPQAKAGTIFLTRTEITRRFAHNSGRAGALRPDDIYLRLIPAMEARGWAKLIRREPAELYAFKANE
jgi:hypothetical protein